MNGLRILRPFIPLWSRNPVILSKQFVAVAEPRSPAIYGSSTSTTKDPGIIGGRGRGLSAVGAGAAPKSAVTV